MCTSTTIALINWSRRDLRKIFWFKNFISDQKFRFTVSHFKAENDPVRFELSAETVINKRDMSRN